MNRTEKLTNFVQDHVSTDEAGVETITPMCGVEIGPLSTPVMAKSDNLKYVDRISTQELKAQYSDDGNVNDATLCEVDHVWGHECLENVISEKLDFVIASHVIEHVPDMIEWLLQIRSVLKSGGVLSLAVPDKRYTFDYLRQLSTIEQFMEAYFLKYKKASPRMVFDYYNNVVTLDGKTSISNRDVTPKIITRIYTYRDALKNAKESVASDKFFDTHNWVFTRESFLEIVNTLSTFGLFPYRIKNDYGVEGCEFIIILEAA